MLKRKLYGLAIGIVAITPISIAQFLNPNDNVARSFGGSGDCVDCRLSREVPGSFTAKGGEVDLAGVNRNLNHDISGFIHGNSFMVGANPVVQAVSGVQAQQQAYAKMQQDEFSRQLAESAKLGPIMPNFMEIPFLKSMDAKALSAPWADYTAALNKGLGGGTLTTYVCDPYRMALNPNMVPSITTTPAYQSIFGFSQQF